MWETFQESLQYNIGLTVKNNKLSNCDSWQLLEAKRILVDLLIKSKLYSQEKQDSIESFSDQHSLPSQELNSRIRVSKEASNKEEQLQEKDWPSKFETSKQMANENPKCAPG